MSAHPTRQARQGVSPCYSACFTLACSRVWGALGGLTTVSRGPWQLLASVFNSIGSGAWSRVDTEICIAACLFRTVDLSRSLHGYAGGRDARLGIVYAPSPRPPHSGL